MQAQLCQRRHLAALQGVHRVLVVDHRQQGREIAHVLLEQIEDRRDPSFSEPDAGAHALSLELLRSGVGRLLEHSDACLAPQLPTEEVRGVRSQAELNARDALRSVPEAGEVVGTHLQVQLGARARRLRKDRLAERVQPLRTLDAQVQVLPSLGKDLLVHQPVARVGRDRVQPGVRRVERRQDADHDQVRTLAHGSVLGAIEAGAHLVLERAQALVQQQSGRDVDLDVELSQLGLEVLVGDGRQHFRVAHRRLVVGVDEIQLDLESGHRTVEVERGLAQHLREHVKTAPHLEAVALSVLPCEGPAVDVLPHGISHLARVLGQR